MRIAFDLNNRTEGDAVARSLGDPLLKTAMVINGMLEELEPRQRLRVLDLVVTMQGASDNFNIVAGPPPHKSISENGDEPRLHYDRGGTSPD